MFKKRAVDNATDGFGFELCKKKLNCVVIITVINCQSLFKYEKKPSTKIKINNGN